MAAAAPTTAMRCSRCSRAIRALQRRRTIPHARCAMMIEACEESGSYDLPVYVDHLATRIGSPCLVVCLDSGCGNYDQLWLHHLAARLAAATLNVRGADARACIRATRRASCRPASASLRQLLSRLEDEATRQHPAAGPLRADPAAAHRAGQGRRRACWATSVYTKFPFAGAHPPMADDPTELILNRTWRPQLADHRRGRLAHARRRGQRAAAHDRLKLSLRLPPTLRRRGSAR